MTTGSTPEYVNRQLQLADKALAEDSLVSDAVRNAQEFVEDITRLLGDGGDETN
jgi:hypothetical protein